MALGGGDRQRRSAAARVDEWTNRPRGIAIRLRLFTAGHHTFFTGIYADGKLQTSTVSATGPYGSKPFAAWTSAATASAHETWGPGSPRNNPHNEGEGNEAEDHGR